MPDPERGWTPRRCADLGAALVAVAAHLEPYLRAEVGLLCGSCVAGRRLCVSSPLLSLCSALRHHPPTCVVPTLLRFLRVGNQSALDHHPPPTRAARAEGPFWETMDARDAYARPSEGTAHSTLPARSAGNVYNSSLGVGELDKQLADAEQMIAQLRLQRAKLA